MIEKATFDLKSVVPWGRSLKEYQQFFNLSNDDLTNKKFISIGDGPASFNAEVNNIGNHVVSLDPIYIFSKEELKKRINEVKDEVMLQTKKNADNFIWSTIKNPEALEDVRMNAMSRFIDDFEAGKKAERYIFHKMPDTIDFPDKAFDIGLSSHFLILYSTLGLDFHIQSITEMLRICKEVRIFPLVNLNAEKSEVLDGIIAHFTKRFIVDIVKVDYEFQKNGNQMMVLQNQL